MKTQREDKILVHVAAPLKDAIEALAAAEGRSISDHVRRRLIADATEHFTTTGRAAA